MYTWMFVAGIKPNISAVISTQKRSISGKYPNTLPPSALFTAMTEADHNVEYIQVLSL